MDASPEAMAGASQRMMADDTKLPISMPAAVPARLRAAATEQKELGLNPEPSTYATAYVRHGTQLKYTHGWTHCKKRAARRADCGG